MNSERSQAAVHDHLHQLDEELALSRVGGDTDLLHEIVDLFLADYPATLEKIRAAVSARDAAAIEHHAHSLKGSVSTFGAQSAFEAALALERQGRNGDLGDVDAGLSQLEFALGALRPELENIQGR